MTEPSSNTRGRVNIAFTPDATAAADRLIACFAVTHATGSYDLDRVDVARFGVAYALRAEHSLNRSGDFGSANGSNFNVGSVDPGGELRDLVLALNPELDEDPYRAIETLMSTGVLAIDRRIRCGEIYSLKTLIGDDPSGDR